MKKSAIVALGVAGLLAATVAWAGYKGDAWVVVDTTNHRAYGALGSARNSVDTVQYIGCTANAYPSGSISISCYAKNSAGTYASCSSSAPEIVNTVRALSGDAYIYFTYDNSGGQCTYVLIENDSWMPPREP